MQRVLKYPLLLKVCSICRTFEVKLHLDVHVFESSQRVHSVQISRVAKGGKNVWSIGKPSAPTSVPYVPQLIDGRTANVKAESWVVKMLNKYMYICTKQNKTL